MFSFIAGIIFVIIAFISFIVGGSARRAVRRDGEAMSRSDLNAAKATAAGGRIAGTLLTLIGLLLIGFACTQVVPANSVGIPTSFGSIGSPVTSGFHVMAPWTDVNTFSTRMQETSMLGAVDEGDKAKDDSIEVRGSDGYLMNVDVTVRYFIEGQEASALFKLVGSEDGIRERLVRPEVRESVRVAFAGHTAEEGYTTGRDAIRGDITADLDKRLARYGLRLDSVAIRNVEPDVTLGKAISERAAAREKALQASIDQERQTTDAETRRLVAETDAAAKRIAAQGEADANRILIESLTPELLELKRIEALRDANTVYVPSDTTIITGQVSR